MEINLVDCSGFRTKSPRQIGRILLKSAHWEGRGMVVVGKERDNFSYKGSASPGCEKTGRGAVSPVGGLSV